MRGDWVAVGVRARGMTRRCLSPDRVHAVAAAPSLEAAIDALGPTQYGSEVPAGTTLAEAQRSVTATLLWNLRVLAGWAPRAGVTLLRALVGPLEIENVIDHLNRLGGSDAPVPYRLGALATAWPRLERASSPEELRHALSASAWGDPGGFTAHDISVAMRASLYDRLIAAVPKATSWASAAALLLVAREEVLAGRVLTGPARVSASRVVGSAAVAASRLDALAADAPTSARWVLDGITDPSELWSAEARWWSRVGRDGSALTRRPIPGDDTLLGAVAVMAHDSRRVNVALELADRGGRDLEMLDAVE